MDKSLLTKCIFNGTDSLLVIVLLAKIIYSFVFYKRKHKAFLNRSFWFYLFFAITYGCVAIVQWAYVFIDAHPLEYLNIDRAFLGFSRNLFFIGSFLYLQIYCYKVVTTRENVDLYSGTKNVAKQTKRKFIIERSTCFFGILCALLQSLLIGVYPLFRENPILRGEVLPSFCILCSFIYLLILYICTGNCKKVVGLWAFFAFLSFLMLSLSALLVSLEIKIYVEGMPIFLILRSLFLLVRSLQIISFAKSVFRFSDVRLLYD